MIEFYFNLALKTISKGHINYQTETENNTHGKIYTQHSKTQEMSKNERHDVMQNIREQTTGKTSIYPKVKYRVLIFSSLSPSQKQCETNPSRYLQSYPEKFLLSNLCLYYSI